MRFANIREMHQASAVGVATEAELDGRGLFLAAHIVDPVAWDKVQSGVYKGFSIGGTVVSRDSAQKHVITGVKLSEISLVDRPANPEAVFTMFKSAEFTRGRLAKVGARNSAADLALIQEIHDRAAALGASCPGCGPESQDSPYDTDDAGGADEDDDAGGDDYGAKIAGLIAERDALKKALARLPAKPKAALRAVAVEKSADRADITVSDDRASRDPFELAKQALRRPMTLAQIERLANGGSGLV
jgi:hypothetical protein